MSSRRVCWWYAFPTPFGVELNIRQSVASFVAFITLWDSSSGTAANSSRAIAVRRPPRPTSPVVDSPSIVPPSTLFRKCSFCRLISGTIHCGIDSCRKSSFQNSESGSSFLSTRSSLRDTIRNVLIRRNRKNQSNVITKIHDAPMSRDFSISPSTPFMTHHWISLSASSWYSNVTNGIVFGSRRCAELPGLPRFRGS